MLSLVIGCLNEGDHLQSTLTEALGLLRPSDGLEISIFDDGSTDNCTGFLDQDPWIQMRRDGLIRLQRSSIREGISRGRHKGALGCRGDVLVFMDAHLGFPQDDLWLRVSDHFSHGLSDLLALDCRDQNSEHSCSSFMYTSRRLDHMTPNWAPRQSDITLDGCVSVPFVNGGFFAIRRSVYERLLGFPLFLQGWGHEDRYLSTLAGYLGFRCAADYRMIVHHLYKSEMAQVLHSFPPCEPCADSLPAEGVPHGLQPEYSFVDHGFDSAQILLLNSLRCGQILYSEDVFRQLLAQLRTLHSPEQLEPVVRVFTTERPQLQAYMERLGLNALQRDEAMRRFFARWRSALPMLVEVELQAVRALPATQALERLKSIPLELGNLAGVDARDFTIARLYIEAGFAHQLSDWSRVIDCLMSILGIHPEYLPALRMLTGALRAKGYTSAYRHWLEHSAAVIERYRPNYGNGPLGAWHPSCMNGYLQNLYIPEADRAIWSDLAELEIADQRPAHAVGWFCKLLEQTPGDRSILDRLSTLHA